MFPFFCLCVCLFIINGSLSSSFLLSIFLIYLCLPVCTSNIQTNAYSLSVFVAIPFLLGLTFYLLVCFLLFVCFASCLFVYLFVFYNYVGIRNFVSLLLGQNLIETKSVILRQISESASSNLSLSLSRTHVRIRAQACTLCQNQKYLRGDNLQMKYEHILFLSLSFSLSFCLSLHLTLSLTYSL